jgi:hypothetical protein
MTLDIYADLFDEDLKGVAGRLNGERTRKLWAFGGGRRQSQGLKKPKA